MPDWYVQSNHFSCNFAPWTCTVNNYIKLILCSIVSCKTFYFVIYDLNICNFHACLYSYAIFLSFFHICIGNHCSIKISVILCISCSKNIFCRNVWKDFFDTVFICNILSCISCCFCKSDSCLNNLLYFFICCYYKSSCLIKSC